MISSISLIRSSTSLRNISKTLTSFSKSLNTSTLLAKDIAKTIQASNVKKKRIISEEQSFFVKRRESFFRKRREGLIEASGIKGALKATGNTIKNTAKGFLGRLLNFIGIVFIGWIITNAPKIIKSIQNIIKSIQNVVGFMGDWINGVRTTLSDFYAEGLKVLSDVTGIDFEEDKKEFQDEFKKGQKSLRFMENDLVQQINIAQDPSSYGIDDKDTKVKETYPKTEEDARNWFDKFITPSASAYSSTYTYSSSFTTGQGSGKSNPNTSGGSSGSSGSVKIGSSEPEIIRIAAAMVTEGAGGTATTDIMQVLANRKASGRYTGYKGDNSYTGLLAADGQFQGVFDRGQDAFVSIQTVEQAAAWAGTTEEEILRRIADLKNPQYRKDSAEFVKGAMEFRGSPETVRKVNTDNNPNNNIEEIGTTGRIPESIWRGRDGDNQFLIGPRDAARPEGAASYSFDPEVSSTNIKTFTNITYTGKKTMPKVKTDKNGPVIVLQQQSQPNTQPVIMASSSSEESIPPFIASGADGLYIKLAALHAAYT